MAKDTKKEKNTEENTEVTIAFLVDVATRFAKDIGNVGGEDRRKIWNKDVGQYVKHGGHVPEGFAAVEFGKTGFPVIVPVTIEAAESHFNGTKNAATGTTGIIAALAAKATHGAEHLRKPLAKDATAEMAARNLLTVGHPTLSGPAALDREALGKLSGEDLLAYLTANGVPLK